MSDYPKTQVLDQGYVQLVETWGSDERVIESARMSTQKGFLGWDPGPCEACEGTGRRLTSVRVWDERPRQVQTGPSTMRLDGGKWHEETRDLPCADCDGAGTHRGDAKLLKYLWDHQHCYDEQTEVLTRRGFVRWHDVAPGDLLGQWDGEADSLVYEAPLELIRRRHQGRMYRVEHGGVDLLTTDNHRMLVKTIVSVPGENRQEWARDWRLLAASEIGHRAMVRYRKHAARRSVDALDLARQADDHPLFPAHADPRAMLRLIVFFVGDGHAGGTRANGLDFHLRKPRKVAFLREVCAELGWELAALTHDQYVVRAEGVTRLFREQFYDARGEKKIPEYLLDLGADDAAAMLDGLRSSDGSLKRGAWEFFSTSVQVAEATQRLVLHAGGAAHVHHGDAISRVMVLSRMLEPVVNQGKRDTSWIEDFDGDVFCAHTRTGVLVVRRNGKIVLSGNSTPFEMAGMTIDVKAPIFVFREWHRHRVPFGYSEMSARYVPLPDENYMPTVERALVAATGNKQAGKLSGADELTKEAAVEWLVMLHDAYNVAQHCYEAGLKAGIPKEVARAVLPVGRYSCMRATANLRGWLGFLTLRCHPSAQWEIRQFADVVAGLVRQQFPRTHAVAQASVGMP